MSQYLIDDFRVLASSHLLRYTHCVTLQKLDDFKRPAKTALLKIVLICKADPNAVIYWILKIMFEVLSTRFAA